MSRGIAPPLFVIGAARSGTTLLYKALCLHPDAAYFNNHQRRLPRHPVLSVTNRLARATPERRRQVWFAGSRSDAYVYTDRRRLRDRLYPTPVEGEPLYAAASFDIGADPAAFHRSVAATLRWGGGRSFVNKRIANLRCISALAAAFPDARFVDITRDGRAVAVSLARVDWWEQSVVWWYGGTPQAWREQGRDPWDLCAWNWLKEVRAIAAGLDTLDPARVLHHSYEKLVREPVRSMRRIAAFAGLDADPGWLRDLERISFGNRNVAGIQAVPAPALARIEAIQAGELSRRGYVVTTRVSG